MLERSAIILAGGRSTRMNIDKGLRPLGGEPLVTHVIRRVSDLVDEVLLVVSSEQQRNDYAAVLGGDAELLIDLHERGSPLVGAITGFKKARGKYAFITGCDTPFISPEAVSLLFRESQGGDGATFQWPNGWVEPLAAVYRVEPALREALEAYGKGDL
ncbi:MAG: molybdenum cofactor guanylyltransferase, partial [Candidatus Bathyarchaeia archaeon]